MIPRRKIITIETVYGYRGYPRIGVTMSCGHLKFFDQCLRARKFVANKSTTECFECAKEIREGKKDFNEKTI